MYPKSNKKRNIENEIESLEKQTYKLDSTFHKRMLESSDPEIKL